MIDDVLRYVCISVQIIVLFIVVHLARRALKKSRQSMPAVFLVFSFVTFLISDLYWLAFVLLNQDARLPFMPTDIADNGVLLLMGSLTASMFRGRRESTATLTAAAFAFAVANAALWIAWTGEWVKDLIGALPFAYLLCAVARSLKLSSALNRREWLALGAACTALLGFQTVMFFVPQPLYGVLDAANYVLMAAGIAFLFVKTARALRGDSSERCVSLAVAAETCCLCAMYMSAEPMWFAADLLCTAAFWLMLRAVERQVAEA